MSSDFSTTSIAPLLPRKVLCTNNLDSSKNHSKADTNIEQKQKQQQQQQQQNSTTSNAGGASSTTASVTAVNTREMFNDWIGSAHHAEQLKVLSEAISGTIDLMLR